MSEGNGFTNKEILLRLEEKVDKILDDHEERIRGLENFKGSFPSAKLISSLAAVVALASGLVTIIK